MNMQYDELEDFIRDNREAFDHQLPPTDIWNRIEEISYTKPKKIISLRHFFKVAASVAILLGGSFLFGNDYISNQYEKLQINRRLPAEFIEIEQYYDQQVSHIYNHLVDFGEEEILNDELVKIDQTIQNLKRALISTPPGTEDEIVKNIVESYQKKLQMLGRALEHIQAQEPLLINVVNNETTL